MDIIPEKQSPLVLSLKEKFHQDFDLKTLVNNLERVGGFIRIAYNAVGAAGHKFTKQQIQIQKLGYDITKLCSKSGLTISEFQQASTTILNRLQSTYEYLLDNEEEFARITLSSVSKLAGDMQKAAKALKKKFEAEETRVFEALKDTQNSRAEEKSQIEQEKKEQIQIKADKEETLILIQEYQKKKDEVERRRRDLEQQEDQAVSEIGEIHPLKEIANAFTSIFGVKIFSGAEKKAEALRQARLEALEAEQAIRDKYHKALTKMTSFAAKIEQSQGKENMSEYAVEALHEASGALRHLSIVMMQAENFWAKMHGYCKSMADPTMNSLVASAVLCSKKERLKKWTSKSFKRQAVEFYAKWVALQDVCTDYMEQIKLTQSDLFRFIAENPTCEQSRLNLKELVVNFLGDLHRDQEALSDKSFQAQEEIKSLRKKPEDDQDDPTISGTLSSLVEAVTPTFDEGAWLLFVKS